MTRVVVDTNVWAVAAGLHADAGAHCVAECDLRLDRLLRDQVLAVDADFRIFDEYYRNLPEHSAPCQLLNQLQRMTARIDYKRCEWDAEGNGIVPDCLQGLDRRDRKFAAVSLTYDPPAPVVNATDPDWQECADGCAEAGIVIEELCPWLL